MKSRDRRLRVAALSAVVLLAPACAHGNDAAPTMPAPTEEVGTAVTGTAVTDAAAAPISSPSPEVSSAPTEAAGTERQPAAARVEVSGGDLPTQVLDGYAHNGGDLVSGEEWSGRFGSAGLPTVTGPGVTLAEAVQRVERRDGRWERTDEASWLAMSNDDRDTVLAAVAAATRVTGSPQRTASLEQAADCVIDTYPASDGVEWTIQGCSYERFPRMLAVGVSRTATTDEAPAVLDPTVTAIAAELDGTVTYSEVRFGAPGPDGSTLYLSTQVATNVDVAAASTAVTAGPLVGWQTFPGEGSLLLSGPSGGTWTLSDRVAVFTWAGRW